MKKPTMARFAAPRWSLLVISTLFLAACAGDLTSPRASSRIPTDASKALVGAVSGVYTFTVNPNYSQLLKFGQSDLAIPAGAICDLETTRYGPAYWNSSCTPETSTVVITATVRDANTSHPRVDFFPALRFNPLKTVKLTLTVSDQLTVSSMAVLKFCNDFGLCIDESLTDSSLKTTVTTDVDGYQIFRRIKHFSGYMVSE